jgi:hypothetical protein
MLNFLSPQRYGRQVLHSSPNTRANTMENMDDTLKPVAIAEAIWYDLYRRMSAGLCVACSCEPAEESVGKSISLCKLCDALCLLRNSIFRLRTEPIESQGT